ncbi:F-type H+-transporting ATPase subunit gamma [Tessaracoccus bendigoensis DSM 12906]|uniref:ATP synthase gamma chain n=1 Tax=Tessaracoccus bendigoensis DSM 12906 TaxID=1123357 RepID=A0A1M6CT16_9ACTN|nr:F0F1 ATP synthase subunit gamma [Tessaracoccus bendigoensis]SHI63878.1 F-type H+-transporting ATPase subunit gamma [Tessaracoccus bendigoensis DSM 12906]
MASSLRELRQRRKSVSTTKKITRAMELIAASRIVKAQQAARAAAPYTRELDHAMTALAFANDEIDHPLLRHVPNPKRSALLVITSDRGLAGAYSSNAIKAGEQLRAKLMAEGQEVDLYVTGQKGVGYYDFRNIPIVQSWTGFSDAPTFERAREIGRALSTSFLKPTEEGGVDQVHTVGTRFVSMVTQLPLPRRLLPVEVVDSDDMPLEDSEAPADQSAPIYSFEPDPHTVLDALFPMFVSNRVFFALQMSAASELASRQRAMKSATDNAQTLIEQLTRQANQARQAEITQEITEIVGGASALAESAGNE